MITKDEVSKLLADALDEDKLDGGHAEACMVVMTLLAVEGAKFRELAQAAVAFRNEWLDEHSRYNRGRWEVTERLDAALRDAGINVGQAPEEKR